MSKEIKSTSTYKKYGRILTAQQERINLAELKKEMITLHLSRKSSELDSPKNFLSHRFLMEVTGQERRIRARLVLLRMRLETAYNTMLDANKAFARYVVARHANKLVNYKTKEARQNYIQHIIEDGVNYLGEISDLVKNIEFLIKDIDSAGFTVNNFVALHELTNERGKVN